MSKRIRFFIQHLSISLMVALLLLSIVFYFWYPIPLAKAVGVTSIILILFFIDMVIGPILGLLIYKEHKKTLKFDLTIIILLQVSALLYGIFTLEQGRPAWIVYNIDRFELVRKNEMILESLTKAQPKFQQVSLLKPKYVMLESSKDLNGLQKDLFTEVFGGVALSQMPDRYREFNPEAIINENTIRNLESLYDYNHDSIVKKILKDNPDASGYLPLKANRIDMSVLLNDKGVPLKIVDLRPWN